MISSDAPPDRVRRPRDDRAVGRSATCDAASATNTELTWLQCPAGSKALCRLTRCPDDRRWFANTRRSRRSSKHSARSSTPLRSARPRCSPAAGAIHLARPSSPRDDCLNRTQLGFKVVFSADMVKIAARIGRRATGPSLIGLTRLACVAPACSFPMAGRRTHVPADSREKASMFRPIVRGRVAIPLFVSWISCSPRTVSPQE